MTGHGEGAYPALRCESGRAARAANRRSAGGWLAVCLVMLLLAGMPGVRAQRSPITAAPQIARAYDAVFDARFDEVPKLLDAACAGREPVTAAPSRAPRPAPTAAAGRRAAPEVCQLLEVISLWGQMQLDPPSTSRDVVFSARVDETIAAIDAWTTREPMRAEAWFYLGGAYGARAQWRVLRGERLAAARDGKRIKEALERALELDPMLQDAYFGIGLYRYYADVAPTAAKIMRWLLALPGGDKVKGLEDMLRARQGGQVLRSEADYQLHLIYLWYEKQPERALELLHHLADSHPRNPRFPQMIAEVEDVYLHDHAASLQTWRALLERARTRKVAEPAMTEARARIGMALELDHLFETDLAVEHLRLVADAQPSAPLGIVSLARLRLAQALDRLGSRGEAIEEYRAAIAAIPAGDPLGVRDHAKLGLRHTPDAGAGLAYRLSLEGWRALERGALPDAGRALSRSLALRPQDQVTRYRQARLREAEKNDAAALELLEHVIGAGTATPPRFYAAACLDAARLYERQQAQPRAIELYQRARAADGADERTKEAAARALARLSPPASSSR